MIKKLLYILFSCALFTIGGCAGHITVSKDFAKKKLSAYALLPISAGMKSPPAEQKLIFIEDSVASALRSSGYNMVDQKAVRSVCKSADCQSIESLRDQFGVDGVFLLNIDSVSRNNFLAGYVNLISGTLKLNSIDGKQLVFIEHTESERGGVLFNSGQVIQGVISQIENSGDSGFARLANKFSAQIVQRIPKSDHIAGDKLGDQIQISHVESNKLQTRVYKICATGTPKAMGTILIDKKQTTLREVSPGNYCTILYIDPMTNKFGSAVVSLKSAFGRSIRREVDLSRKQVMAYNSITRAEDGLALWAVSIAEVNLNDFLSPNLVGANI